jgi:serine/threonine protein kinase
MGNDRDPASPEFGKTSPGPAPALVSSGELPPGYVVGEYRIANVLGRGGMGVVYAGTQPIIEKRVAIKVLHSELSAEPDLVRRFLDEARAVNRIRHPNIIDIFSFGQLADGRQYFVMEYLEGRTLAERLIARDLAPTDLPLLLGQICDALDAAHTESIVHRDLKPENIWIVEPRRGRPFVKLLDFGIAKLLVGAPSTTQTGVLMGTPQYMSPEQCHGREIDARTDVYAMGVILYEVFAGKLPFSGDTFAEILTKQLTESPEPPSRFATMSSALETLILRCLAKAANDRPQSAHELGEELGRVLSIRPASPTAMVSATAVKGPAITTLRGSAQGLEQLEVPVEKGRRWPWLLLVVPVAAAGVLLLTERRAPAPKGSPMLTTSQPSLPSPSLMPMAHDAGADRGSKNPEAVAASKPPTEEPERKADPKRKPTAAPGSGKPSRSRASSSGLVTDNPFR